MELLAGFCVIIIAVWSNWLLHGLFDFYSHRYRMEKACRAQEHVTTEELEHAGNTKENRKEDLNCREKNK